MEQFVYIGLGNVGSRFAGTRHNLGIETLRAWVEAAAAGPAIGGAGREYEVSDWQENKDSSCQESRVVGQERQVHCLFPTVMMNNSGQAVASYLDKKPVPLSRVVVIHDDVELPLGTVRLVAGGSAKGHNGVRSIQQELGATDFLRLRLGVGRPPEGTSLNEFVLEKFRSEEHNAVQEVIGTAAQILSEVPSAKN